VYIVIAGAGLTGTQLADRLARTRHDVVIVDQDKERCEQVYADLGVVAVNGSATDPRVLEDAGIERANVSVALMRGDADNMSFTLLARRYGVPRRLVRMRDPRYEEAYELAGATYILRETSLSLQELLPAIESPVARRIAEIGHGEDEIVAIAVPDGASIAGQTITDVVRRPGFPESCVFVAIFDRERKLTIPRGDTVIHAGNEVLVVSTVADLPRVIKFLTE